MDQDPELAAWRKALPIGACLLCAAAVSIARDLVTGTLSLDERNLALVHRIWPFALFGIASGAAGHLYLRALRAPREIGRSRLLAGAVAIHLLAAPALPLTSSDLFSQLSYARLDHLGRNPYTSSPADLGGDEPLRALVSPTWIHAPSVYGPVTALAGKAIGPVADLAGALAAFKLEMLGAALLSIVLAWGFCRTCLPPAVRDAAFVFFAWNPLFAWEVSAQAHTEGLLLAALVGFVWAARREREWPAIACLALAFYAKIVLLPLIGLYLCLVARRSLARALAMAFAVALLGVLLFLPFWQGQRSLGFPLGSLLSAAATSARSLADFAVWATQPFGPSVQRPVLRVANALGFALLAVFGIRAALRARSLDQVLRDGLVFYLLYDLVAAPWFQSWYALWILPLALALPDPRWRNLVAVYSVLLLVQYGIPLDPVTYLAIDLYVATLLWRLLRPAGGFFDTRAASL
jgi:hypothetical protein